MDSSDGVSPNPQRGPFIGRPMPRFEDLRLVRGGGRYTDDVSVAEPTSAVFVRTPPAPASIVAVDNSHAARPPLAVDLAAAPPARARASGLAGAPPGRHLRRGRSARLAAFPQPRRCQR